MQQVNNSLLFSTIIYINKFLLFAQIPIALLAKIDILFAIYINLFKVIFKMSKLTFQGYTVSKYTISSALSYIFSSENWCKKPSNTPPQANEENSTPRHVDQGLQTLELFDQGLLDQDIYEHKMPVQINRQAEPLMMHQSSIYRDMQDEEIVAKRELKFTPKREKRKKSSSNIERNKKLKMEPSDSDFPLLPRSPEIESKNFEYKYTSTPKKLTGGDACFSSIQYNNDDFIAGQLDRPRPTLEKQPEQIQKHEILAQLERTLHAKLSHSVMTDITFFEDTAQFNVLGRTKVQGSSSKQMRHVIPYSFISKVIEHIVTTSLSPQESFSGLIDVLPIFVHAQKGFALTAEHLASSPFKALSSPIRASANRSMEIGGTTMYLLSPGQKKLLGTPSKQQIAAKGFPQQNLEYIKSEMQTFSEIIGSCDSNTAIIASELLSRFIFSISNQSDNISFAKEGNTASYEIRLYKTKKAAAAAKKDYEVVTAKELKEMKVNSITKCIRLVNNEGARVKAAPKSLDNLNKIIDHYVMHNELNVNLIKNYNKTNFKLKLANSSELLPGYNNDIPTSAISAQLIKTAISKHVAKILYNVLDLTALEQDILIPCRRGGKLNIYTHASGDRISKYSIGSGDDYRENEINAARGYSSDNVFRTIERDLQILPQKLAELFIIATHPFNHLNHANQELSEQSLNNLIHLASIDYNMKLETSRVFSESTREIYNSLSSTLALYAADEADILGAQDDVVD